MKPPCSKIPKPSCSELLSDDTPGATRYSLGRRAEDHAAEWLLAQGGCRLLRRNFRAGRGEIDLILEEDGPRGRELVFVEVRSRAEGDWVGALASVDGAKRWRIESAARVFVSLYRGRARQIRFDVMGWDGAKWERCRRAW